MAQVKLLNHETIDYNEAIKKMYDDSFYYGTMGLERALSYSSIKWLLKSPKWFEYMRRNPQPETQALRDGRLIHAAILEPQKYQTEYTFVDVSTKNTIKFKDAVTKYGKAYTYTMKEKYMNDRIATAFLQNDKCVSFLKGAECEIPQLTTIDGLPIRAKADVYKAGEYVADVKTTNDGVENKELANGEVVNQFKWTVSKYDYDLQAYLYCLMFEVPDYYWLVIDKSTTDIGIFKASEETLENGRLKLEAALQIYKAFFVDELIDLSQYYKEGII